MFINFDDLPDDNGLLDIGTRLSNEENFYNNVVCMAWAGARLQEQPPMMENVYWTALCCILENYIKQRWPEAECEYRANCLDSDFKVNGNTIYDYDDLLEAVGEKKDDNVQDD